MAVIWKTRTLMAAIVLLLDVVTGVKEFAWTLAWRWPGKRDLCLTSSSSSISLTMDTCHGGESQQWYWDNGRILNSNRSWCLTRAGWQPDQMFVIIRCDRPDWPDLDRLHLDRLQRFAISPGHEENTVVISQGGMCLNFAWTGYCDRWCNGTLTAEPCNEQYQRQNFVMKNVNVTCLNKGGDAKSQESKTKEVQEETKTCEVERKVELEIGQALAASKQQRDQVVASMNDMMTHLSSLEERISSLTSMQGTNDPKVLQPQTSQILVSDVVLLFRLFAVLLVMLWLFGVLPLILWLIHQNKVSQAHQGKFETKVNQGGADQLAAMKQRMEQSLDQLLGLITTHFSTMEQKISNLSSQMDSHRASDTSSSAGSSSSWTHITSGQPSCFLPETFFWPADGDRPSQAKTMFKGAEVMAANGKVVEVVLPPEQHQVDAVIELRAGQSLLVVSPDYRILVPGNKTVQARELEVGSDVILDGAQAALTSLEWKLQPTMVLKIAFRPDLPVAAFMRPPSILSKGSRQRPFRRGKKKTDGAQDAVTIPEEEAQDAMTIPDTEGYLSD